MTNSEITVMFRWPRFPVIVLSSKGLTAARDRKRLFGLLKEAPQSDSIWDVRVIDVAGCEFWLGTAQRILAPGLGAKKWTKKQLVDLYNARWAPGRDPYSPGSISNSRLGRIVADIAGLLSRNEATQPREGAGNR